MKKILLSLFVCVQFLANGQTVIEADTIFSDAGSFNLTLSQAWLLGDNVTAATTSATTFPYSPSSSFEPNIGYVSEFDVTTGTITHVFASPESVSQVLIWNAYFDFELDHCVKDVQLIFWDETDTQITTENVDFAESTAAVLTPEVITLPTEILGVKKIEFVVSTLWGGNEISIRRLGYAGNQMTSVFDHPSFANEITAYPNPAVDHVTIDVGDVNELVLIDVMGRKMNTTFSSFVDRTEVSWNSIEPGIYFLNILSDDGVYTSRIHITSN